MDRYRPKLGPQLLSKFWRGSSIEINVFLPVNARLGSIILPACVLGHFPLASHWSLVSSAPALASHWLEDFVSCTSTPTTEENYQNNATPLKVSHMQQLASPSAFTHNCFNALKMWLFMFDKHKLLTLLSHSVYALTERNMYVYISMTVIPITPSKNKINSWNTLCLFYIYSK